MIWSQDRLIDSRRSHRLASCLRNVYWNIASTSCNNITIWAQIWKGQTSNRPFVASIIRYLSDRASLTWCYLDANIGSSLIGSCSWDCRTRTGRCRNSIIWNNAWASSDHIIKIIYIYNSISWRRVVYALIVNFQTRNCAKTTSWINCDCEISSSCNFSTWSYTVATSLLSC